MNFATKKEKHDVAKMCLMMDVLRDEIKICRLLAVKQNPPTRIALLRLKQLLRERRNLYK